MRKNITTILAVALVGALSFGDEDCTGSNLCDLAKLIKVCKALEGNPQIKPFSTEITCSGNATSWELKSSGTLELKTKFIVSNKVSMKGGKYFLPQSSATLPNTSSSGECHTYQELSGSYTPVVKTLTSCADLEAVAKVGQTAYCKKVLVEAGSSLSEIKPTGKIYSTCPKGQETEFDALLGGQLSPVRVGDEKSGFTNELEVKTLASPAGLLGKAGLSVGDRLSHFNKEQVDSLEELENLIHEAFSKGVKTVEIVYFSRARNQYSGTSISL